MKKIIFAIGLSSILMFQCSKKNDDVNTGIKESQSNHSSLRINNWTPVNSSVSQFLLRSDFQTTNVGFISGTQGRLLKTTNGGSSYTPLTSGTTQDLYAIDMYDQNIGFAAGNNSVMLKTTNGGTTWNPLTIPTSCNFRAIQVLTDQIVFAAGGNGVLLKTTNGGTSWSTIATGTTQHIYGIYFSDVNTGMICGGASIIRTTVDGGASWTTRASGVPTNTALTDVSFLNPTTGFACGNYYNQSNGWFMLKTTTGGTTWSVYQDSLKIAMTGVAFADAQYAYAVGGFINGHGTIYETSDGGNSWHLQKSLSTGRLNDVFMIDANNGYTVGYGGTVQKGSF